MAHLAQMDELISAVQKCIRRAWVEQACYFAHQIILAGFGQYLLKRLLMTISVEDVGFGWPEAPYRFPL